MRSPEFFYALVSMLDMQRGPSISWSGSGGFLVVVGLLGMGCRSRPASEPQPGAAAAAAAPVPVLAHESFTIASRVLGETRRMNVYTPPGPEGDDGARYPVLYMPDGGVAEDFPHVTRTIDDAIRAGEMRPIIVVGIENTERRRDMTGPTAVDADRKIAPRVGGSARFRGFEPEMFDVYIAISPSLWWNDRSLLRSAGSHLQAHPNLSATLYLTTAGDDDIDGAGEALAAALRHDAPAKLRWLYEPMPSEKHGTIYRAASPVAFRKVFPPADAPSPAMPAPSGALRFHGTR